ncbi:MAG: Unknown protein [uncultured Sulfurovum sp.]|uniref:Uncharacterized protein n=1 Tax=uncultured Sulfurovum sp. TaxID=269237 RepID=A0A6S6TER0_9BACT|nr:MAG: Unknown protein [uncultured Sulfurovum sp.]
MNYETLGLKENPFRLTPPLDPKEIVWAGMSEVKSKLEKRIELGIRTRPSRIILNWGSYGSGKTHASLYFSKTDRLQELTTKLDAKPSKSIKITLPRSSSDIVQEFLRSFLGQYSLEEIYSDFQKLKDEVGEEQLVLMITNFSNDTVIGEVFKTLINTEDDKYFNILKNYIYGDSTKSTLNSLELPYGLKNDEQVANFIATIINCVTYEKQHYSSFIIWLDEFEDIDTIKKILADRFTTFLRQFIDKTPNNLMLFLNFTQKAFMDREDLSISLGEALSSRAKLKIDFENPTTDEAIAYVKELSNIYLIEDKELPFEDDALIKYVVEHMGNLTTRKINETFSIILEMALIEEKEKIDQTFIDSIQDEIIAWEE